MEDAVGLYMQLGKGTATSSSATQDRGRLMRIFLLTDKRLFPYLGEPLPDDPL